MKTLEQISQKYNSQCLDGRDLSRLAVFIPFDNLKDFGIEPREGVTKEEWDKNLKPFTRDNILKQLESDNNFGFEKALKRRGLSSDIMYDVVDMWNWILEEGLENFSEDNYKWYGLPLFIQTAKKYDFDIPEEIDKDDAGTENGKYCSQYCENCPVRDDCEHYSEKELTPFGEI